MALLSLPQCALAVLDGVAPEAGSEVARSTVAVVVEDNDRTGPNGSAGYYPGSGIVIARDWILTVRHTFADHQEPRFAWWLQFDRRIGRDAAGRLGRPLSRNDVIMHPDLDLALVRIADGVPMGYRPIPLLADVRRLPSGSPFTVFLAGFGAPRDHAGRNELTFVAEPLSSIGVRPGPRWPADLIPAGQGGNYLEVDQRDGRGSCSGDSGGPVLARADNGTLGLIGVIKGNASINGRHPCLGWSYALRIDRALPWIVQVTGRIYDPVSMTLVRAQP